MSDTAYGFTSRGCPRGCGFCIVPEKEGRESKRVADLAEFYNGQRNIVLQDPNLLACPEHLEIMEDIVRSGAYIDINQGLDIRLTDSDEISLINKMKIKNVHFAWDNPNDELEERFAVYTEKAKRKCHGRFGTVYVLTNYGSSMEQDLYRVQVLEGLGYDPYVMVYDKPNAIREKRDFQRWVNNKFIFRKCEWKDYKKK